MKVVHRVETLGDVIQHCHHHLDCVPDEDENELIILIELSLNILRGDQVIKVVADEAECDAPADRIGRHGGYDRVLVLFADAGIGFQDQRQVADEDPRLAAAAHGRDQLLSLLTGRDIQRHLPSKVPLAYTAVFDGRAVHGFSRFRPDPADFLGSILPLLFKFFKNTLVNLYPVKFSGSKLFIQSSNNRCASRTHGR